MIEGIKLVNTREKIYIKILSIVILVVYCVSSFTGIGVYAAQAFKLNSTDIETLCAILRGNEDLYYLDVEVEDFKGEGYCFYPIHSYTSDTGAGVPIENGIDGISALESADMEWLFNYSCYKNMTEKQKKKVMKSLVDEIVESAITKNGKQQMYNSLMAYDDRIMNLYISDLLEESTKADIASANYYTSGLTPWIRLAFGFVCWAVFLTLILSTVLDMAWMGIPIVQEIFGKDGKKPWWVTTEAQKALEEYVTSEASGNCKNMFLIYFIKRFFVYVSIGVLVSILVAGKFGSVFSDLFGLITQGFI